MTTVDVTKPHVRACTVQFDGDANELQTIGWEVSEQIDWCPTSTVTLRIALPVGFDTDKLDPRTPTPITVRLNTYPLDSAGSLDPAQTATFRLLPRAVQIDWTAREARLTAHTTDMLSLWYPYNEVLFTTSHTLETALVRVRDAYAPTPIFIDCNAPAIAIGEATTWRRSVTGATFLRDLADAASCELLGQRDGGWLMVEQSVLNNPSAPVMTLTPLTIMTLTTDLDVQRFGNAATTQYENDRWAQTAQTTGPYAVGTIGYRTRYVDQTNIPLESASSSGSILRRSLRRGDALNVTALAFHPLKVGDWVRVDWDADLDVTLRVDSLRFTSDGLMTLSCTDPNA